jgi:diacylglycerol kinase (ATP)
MIRPQTARRNSVVLVASPHARHGEHLEGAVARLLEAGIKIGLRLTVDALDTEQLQGLIWRRAGHSAAIVAGGDGAIGAVASHLAESGLALGILPLGTSNDVARSLGIPLELKRAVETIAAGHTLALDAGQVIPSTTTPSRLRWRKRLTTIVTGKPAPLPGAYFLHTATIGFNVRFAELAADPDRRERLGALNYLTALLETAMKLEPIETHIQFSGVASAEGRADTLDIQTRALQIAAINTPVFGGGLNLRVPGVSPRDELLDFLIVEPFEASLLGEMAQALLATLGGLGAWLFGQSDEAEPASQAPHAPGVLRFRAREAAITTATPQDVTLDGEVRAQTPMVARIAPEKLRVYLPAEARAAFVQEEHQEESQPDATPKEAERRI